VRDYLMDYQKIKEWFMELGEEKKTIINRIMAKDEI